MSVAVAPPPAACVPGIGATFPLKVAPASLVARTCPVLARTNPTDGLTNDCEVTVGVQFGPGTVNCICVKLTPPLGLIRS